MSKRQDIYRYDVAVSYAGEDRAYVEAFVSEAEARGLRVFYDKRQFHELWGENQTKYERIYGPDSRFVMPFISRNYVRKEWPRFEFDTAKREEKRRKTRFILPVKLDKSRILGLADDVTFLPYDHLAKDMTDLLLKLCGNRSPKKKRDLQTSSIQHGRPNVVFLSRDTRHAMGLIVTSITHLPMVYLRKLFADVDWTRHCRILRKYGLIIMRNESPCASDKARRLVSADEDETIRLRKEWIKALEKAQSFVDISFFLSAHYLRSECWDRSVTVLTGLIDENLGEWNESYLTVLRRFASSRTIRKLTSPTVCDLYNSLGLCLSHAQQFEEACSWFKRLRTYSRRRGLHNWVGQGFLNEGVAQLKQAMTEEAARSYKKALELGRKQKDKVLISHSLGNLSQVMVEKNPNVARNLLMESISIKKRIGDRIGIVVAHGQMGILDVEEGNLPRATKWFSQGLKLAQSIGLTYLQSEMNLNLGKARYDSGSVCDSIENYAISLKIARKEGFPDLFVLAANGLARSLFESGKFTRSKSVFQDLLHFAESRLDHQNAISALHGIGVIELSQGRNQVGQNRLRRALRMAREAKETEWMVRCLLDMCRSAKQGPNIDLAKLNSMAQNEMKQKNWLVAGQLWKTIARSSRNAREEYDLVQSVYRISVCCNERAGCIGEIVETESEVFCWQWSSGRYAEAIDTLKRVESAGLAKGYPLATARALDQQGICLQELGRTSEALSLHRRASSIARKINDPVLRSDSLNNIGEALRKMHRFKESLAAFEKSEQIAAEIGNIKGTIATAYNRALSLEELDDYGVAESILLKCRAKSWNHQFWSEYARSWEALANLAWRRGRFAIARSRYRRALSEAKKHKQGQIALETALNFSRFLQSQGEGQSRITNSQQLPRQYSYTLGCLLLPRLFG